MVTSAEKVEGGRQKAETTIHRPIRVGVVGMGRGAGLAAVCAHHPAAELVAVCDVDPQRLQQAAERLHPPHAVSDYERLLALDLEVVVVATPPALHVPQSVAALQAGKHVLCEVPAATSMEECIVLQEAVRRTGQQYMMVENVLWFPRTRAWKQKVEAGEIGQVFYAEAEYLHDCRSIMRDAAGQPTWRAFLAPIHYIIHSLGPLLHWTGDRCVSVVGLHTGSRLLPEYGTIALEAALFHTASGAVFKVVCGFTLEREPALHYYSLYGTQGTLEASRIADQPDRLFRAAEREKGMQPLPFPYPEPDLPPASRLGGHGASEWLMIEAFLSALQEGRPVPGGVERALQVTLPGLCAHQSAEQGGTPVAIPAVHHNAHGDVLEAAP